MDQTINVTLNDPVTQISGKVVVLPFSSDLIPDASQGNTYRVILTATMKLDNPINMVDGQKLLFELVQGGSGGYSLTFGTKIHLSSDISDTALSATVGAKDFLGMVYDLPSDTWTVIAFARGG